MAADGGAGGSHQHLPSIYYITTSSSKLNAPLSAVCYMLRTYIVRIIPQHVSTIRLIEPSLLRFAVLLLRVLSGTFHN